jgi:hypothetical protein
MKQYDMNDDVTRRQVFWLLQRLTSYTLWERKRDAWEAFTRAYETAIRTWPKSQPEQMEADKLPRIYDVLSLYNKGLEDLAKGNRIVWNFGQALYEAERSAATIQSNFYRDPEYWERGMQLQPYPPKVEALNQLMIAAQYQGDQAPLEIDYGASHLGAQWSSPGLLLNPDAYDYGFFVLPYPVFPEPLPEVPEPGDVIIQSGESVPVDGIWEPVDVRQDRLLGIIPFGEKVMANNGCFNYLVKGVKAPRITGQYNEATSRTDQVETHWQLLWEDRRYKDGTLPDESQYFLQAQASRPVDATSNPGEVSTGERCPVSGLWAAKEYDVAPVRVLAGSTMPDLLVRDNLGERKVHWVTWRLIKAD